MKKRDDLLQLWLQLLQTQHDCVQAVEAAMLAAGVSLATFEILYRLSRAPLHQLRMQALASTLLLTPSGVSRAVEKGERLRLLERRQDGSDERGRLCVLRPQGMELLRTAQPIFFAALQELFPAALTAEEVQVLTRLLAAVSEGKSRST